MSDQIEFSMDPDHALTAFWVTWEALGVAVREVARLTGDERHLQRLRDEMLAPFLGRLVEIEEGAGVTHPSFTPYLQNFELAAIQTGIKAVDAAVARTSFSP